ncbi:hypothetical protein PTKIN_Ptkin15bG0184300 [Pterospermum kingtungense]
MEKVTKNIQQLKIETEDPKKIQTEETPKPIRFDQHFFMCRQCRNHVLSQENVCEEAWVIRAFVCKSPVNVHTVADRRIEPLRRVVCNQCNGLIGLEINSESAVPERRFIFSLLRMLYCNGVQVIDCDTQQPVLDN